MDGRRAGTPEEWRRAASSTDTFVPATAEQAADLGRRLTALVTEWSAACRQDAEVRPDVVRRPVSQVQGLPERAGRTVSATSRVEEPRLIGAAPPPVREDRMVRVWVAAVRPSWFGDAMWTVALAWTAAHTLSPVAAGIVLGLETLPAAVLVLVGGVLADRFDTRRVMVTGQVAQALVMLIGAIAWTAGLRGAVTLGCLATAFGITIGLTLPAGMTLARQRVRGRDLGTVSGWNNVAVRIARLLGAPVGGLLVAYGAGRPRRCC